MDEVTSSGLQWADAGAAGVALYANSITYFNHTDWLGSIRAWSGMSGTAVGTCTNLPYGDGSSCTGTSPNSWHYTGYTGLPYDSESGLTHAMFRQLSTTEGRWTTTDPAGLAAADPANPQSWNRYAYVNNTPVIENDPLGLYWACTGPPGGETCVWYPDDDGGGGGGGGTPPGVPGCQSSSIGCGYSGGGSGGGNAAALLDAPGQFCRLICRSPSPAKGQELARNNSRCNPV